MYFQRSGRLGVEHARGTAVPPRAFKRASERPLHLPKCGVAELRLQNSALWIFSRGGGIGGIVSTAGMDRVI